MNHVTYDYGPGLYINMTNRCDCACVFCLRNHGENGSVRTGDLWLEREPTRQEVLEDLLSHNLADYDEIVFCGYGEPTCRADDLLWICDQLRAKVKTGLPPIRLNTNGHGSLIAGRDIVPELKGRVDAVSVSLNGSTPEEYLRLTRPRQWEKAWQAMLDFVREAAKTLPSVTVTIVDYEKTPEEIAACQALAEELGADFRVRVYAPD